MSTPTILNKLNETNEAVQVSMKQNRRGRSVPDYNEDDVDFEALTNAVNALLTDEPVSVVQVEDAYFNQRRALETITQEPLFMNVAVMAHLVLFHSFNLITVDNELVPVVTLNELYAVTSRGKQTMTKHFEQHGLESLTDSKTQQFNAYAAYAVALTIDTRSGGSGGSKVFIDEAIKAFASPLQEAIDEANEVLEEAGLETIDTLIYEGIIAAMASGLKEYKAAKAAKKAAKAE